MVNSTAAIVIIGDEILSGRTLDLNTRYIARRLSEHGITLVEARTIHDNCLSIITTILELKEKYKYIFTTGGIGPTHDDITSKAVADAFNLPLEIHKVAYNTIKAYYDSLGKELNAVREKMAYLPRGSTLISNPMSCSPAGFIIENVYVLAGVPHIIQTIFDHILPTLQKGMPVKSKQIKIMMSESTVATEFAILQSKYPEVIMGSYPFKINNEAGTTLVLRSLDENELEQAYTELENLLKAIYNKSSNQ